jgi:hypothetical protein
VKSIHGHGHLREYTQQELERIFAANGLELTHCRYIQPSVRDVFTRPEPLHSKLVKGLYYALSMLPSLKLTIYIEARRRGNPGFL